MIVIVETNRFSVQFLEYVMRQRISRTAKTDTLAIQTQNRGRITKDKTQVVRHHDAREVALGIDYWIEPSIVWQTEFDTELPRAGGTLFSFGGASTPTASPIGATSNDHAVLTQFAIGF